ncbi:MAG: acyl-CoA dehydrogenase family protein [Frankiales bacterium]|nr:acyl-CoA dehydrogenase family protein [Frankiales bacterium]
MRVLPDADALEFATAVRELLTGAADVEALRAAWDSSDGRVPGLWKRLADVGVVGLTVPEAAGGAGMDITALVPVLVEAGRAAVPEPLIETSAAVALLATAGPGADEWLPGIASGEVVAALGEGREAVVAGARWADVFLLADDAGDVHLLPRDAVTIRDQPTLDNGIGLGLVTWSPGDGTALAQADGLAAFDLACVAAAAELVGLATAMLDMAVRYALQREQFGKPIGSFQAVKHQLADVYVGNAFALPVVHRAAWSVAKRLPSRRRDASHAKYAATVAAERAARTALQVHAGIGYTYEHDLHMWMKRTWSLATLWGDVAFHRRRVAAAVLADAPPPRVP